MGAKIYEISCIRKTRDHPHGGALIAPRKWTLDKLGVQRRTFYRWYDRYLEQGEDALVDRAPDPGRVWNKIRDSIRSDLLDMALDIPELSPRELAVRSLTPKATLSLRAQSTAF